MGYTIESPVASIHTKDADHEGHYVWIIVTTMTGDRVQVVIPTQDADEIKVGQRCTISFDSSGGRKYSQDISQISVFIPGHF